MEKVNQRVFDAVKSQMTFLFKDVLLTLESEAKKYKIDEKFFKSQGELTGFLLVRKRLLDDGNGLLNLLSILLENLEIIPKNAKIKFIKEKKNGNTNS